MSKPVTSITPLTSFLIGRDPSSPEAVRALFNNGVTLNDVTREAEFLTKPGVFRTIDEGVQKYLVYQPTEHTTRSLAGRVKLFIDTYRQDHSWKSFFFDMVSCLFGCLCWNRLSFAERIYDDINDFATAPTVQSVSKENSSDIDGIDDSDSEEEEISAEMSKEDRDVLRWYSNFQIGPADVILSRKDQIRKEQIERYLQGQDEISALD